ncbi:hypothetical protein CCR95_04270 [Thiocystis minor]|nr:hypothetical protein [Thiocystis minor]
MTVRIFVDELVKFIRTNINEEIDMSEEEEIRNSILSSTENLESALLISKSMPAIKNDLIKQFQSDLENKIIHKPYEVIWDQNFHWGGKHSGFYFSFLKQQNKYLWFEFDGGFRGLKWGICRESENISRNETVWNEINLMMTTAFSGWSTTDDWWAWYSKDAEIGEDFGDWTISVRPWQEILGKTLADRFIAIVDKVYTLFDNRQHLLMPAQTVEIKSSS